MTSIIYHSCRALLYYRQHFVNLCRGDTLQVSSIIIKLRLTTTHFFPCNSNFGGFFGATAAVLPTGLYADTFGLKGTAACFRRSGFLCVFISLLTFFKPIMEKVQHGSVSLPQSGAPVTAL